MHLGKSALPKKPISDDDVDWLSLCIRVLNDRCVFDLLENSIKARTGFSCLLNLMRFNHFQSVCKVFSIPEQSFKFND